ncbi:MAG: hypothetical protein P4L40_09185 [Terracidiphilus sp.]|nr:hypothetical protein [Terracidiphilus sp.]
MSSPASPQSVAHTLDTPRLLGLWHLSSLDAPTVAVVWSLALARAAEVRLPSWLPLLIALGTWAVYISDRLLDARRALRTGETQALRERHWFHWRHRRGLALAACAAAGLCVVLVFAEMPLAFRARNSVLAVAALVYFGGVHLPRKPRGFPALASKELLVGVLFTSGCALPALLRADSAGRTGALTAAAYLAVLAWLNCHAIDRWEGTHDARIAKRAWAVAATGLMLAWALHAAHPAAARLVTAAAVSALLLALLDLRRARMTALLLRVMADLVLLTPVLLLR